MTTAYEFDSPIEFVVVGPWYGQDTVLAKSKGAGIDLIGLSLGRSDGRHFESRSDPFSSLFPQSRQIHSVRASSISDLHQSSDERTSDLIFSWAGSASALDIERVTTSFRLQSREIAMLASDGNQTALEISLAPVVLECSQANEKRSRFRRLLIATTILYIAFGILGIGFASFAYFTTHVFR